MPRIDFFPYHVEIGGVMQAHADTIGEARMIASYLRRHVTAGQGLTITCTDGIGYRIMEDLTCPDTD